VKEKTQTREGEDCLPLADEVMYSKRVVYQDTGEVKDKIIVRFTLEVDTERKAQLVRERMSPFFRFPTTSPHCSGAGTLCHFNNNLMNP